MAQVTAGFVAAVVRLPVPTCFAVVVTVAAARLFATLVDDVLFFVVAAHIGHLLNYLGHIGGQWCTRPLLPALLPPHGTLRPAYPDG